jgi:hypothetical protein
MSFVNYIYWVFVIIPTPCQIEQTVERVDAFAQTGRNILLEQDSHDKHLADMERLGITPPVSVVKKLKYKQNER